jgi:hypothetical protein
MLMRLHEFSNPLKHYLATVRVVLHGTSSTVRTTITADTAIDAKKLLAAIVGDNNVLSISHIVSEAPLTDQIQREQAIRPQTVCRRAQPRKIAQIQPLAPTTKNAQRPISAEPIPNQIKHKLIQDKLTRQYMRQLNIVKPTSDDIRIAKNRAATQQKRVDLAQKNSDERLLRKRSVDN